MLGRLYRKLRPFLGAMLLLVPILTLGAILIIALQYIPPYTQQSAASQTGATQANVADVWRAWKDAFIVVATGTIALIGTLVGGFIQSQRERQNRWLQLRQNRVQPYRDYLAKLMNIDQRVDMVNSFTQSKQVIEAGIAAVTDDERNFMLRAIPPIRELSAIDDKACRESVDRAIELALRYWNDASNSRPTSTAVQGAYRKALDELARYENLT